MPPALSPEGVWLWLWDASVSMACLLLGAAGSSHCAAGAMAGSVLVAKQRRTSLSMRSSRARWSRRAFTSRTTSSSSVSTLGLSANALPTGGGLSPDLIRDAEAEAERTGAGAASQAGAAGGAGTAAGAAQGVESAGKEGAAEAAHVAGSGQAGTAETAHAGAGAGAGGAVAAG